jgi:hypothetical protein
MGKCWKCDRQGVFLAIGPKSGLCIDCLEDANEAALDTIRKIKAGGEIRDQVLKQIDSITAIEVAEQAVSEIVNSPFSVWDISTHSSPDQLNRIRRSTSVKILSYDEDTQTAIVASSGGRTYTTTFTSCSCGDFIAKHLPCKHMYSLASKHGGVDFTKYL